MKPFSCNILNQRILNWFDANIIKMFMNHYILLVFFLLKQEIASVLMMNLFIIIHILKVIYSPFDHYDIVYVHTITLSKIY